MAGLLAWCDSGIEPRSLPNEEIITRSLRTSRQVVWLACRQCQAKAQAPGYTPHKAMTWQLLGKDDAYVQHRFQTAALNLDSFFSSQTSPGGGAQTTDTEGGDP